MGATQLAGDNIFKGVVVQSQIGTVRSATSDCCYPGVCSRHVRTPETGALKSTVNRSLVRTRMQSRSTGFGLRRRGPSSAVGGLTLR
eukprot:16446829-Heterocapsa_arctica.AAC.1